jgi:beta-1,4-mannosyl-glycoprotein beta-1,4-N-acetylglucosaminyltransferase
MQIIDCFTFYNELELLLYRLTLLNDTVDYFVIVESTHTHMGNEKPLFFNENKHLFTSFTKKIIHIVVSNFPHKNTIDVVKREQWKNENFQRDAISRGTGCLELGPNDVIMITDLDEIVDPTTLISIKKGDIIVDMNSLEMDMYYYNLTTRFKSKWRLGKIMTFQQYTKLSNLCDIRYNSAFPIIKNGGWHLSYFGNSTFIQNKLYQFGHQEFNNIAYTDLTKIEERINKSADLFDRHIDIEKVNITDNTYLPIKYELYLTKYIA